MKLLLTTVIIILNLGFSFSQVTFLIKDGIALLSSNPSFITSIMGYERFAYSNTELNGKFIEYESLANPQLTFIYSHTDTRINVVAWKEQLTNTNYNSILNDISHAGFSAGAERISDYTDFNTSFQYFDNLAMNCVVSVIEDRNDETITISISRKNDKNPLIIPNTFLVFQGSKIFVDGHEAWNLTVNISDNKFSVKTEPHPENEYWKNEKYTPFTINGTIKNSIIYSTIPEEGATKIWPSIYRYFKGKFYEANNEGGYNEYYEYKTYSSTTVSEVTEGQIFKSVEINPEPPGGMEAFMKWLGENYIHPQEAVEAKVSGQVQISFVVERDGSLTNFKIVKGLGYGTAEAALALLQKSGKWSPGIQNGRPVRVANILPIRVNLNE